MTRLSDAQRFRRLVAGWCMVLAPLVLLVGMILHPDGDRDAAAQLAIVREDADRWFGAHLLVLIAIPLMLAAVLGLMHMLREREAALGHMGGGLAALGLLALTGLVAIELVQWQAASSASADAMAGLFDRLDETAGIVVPFYVTALGFVVGLVLLAAGLYRARAVHSWMAVFLVVAAVMFVLQFATAATAFGILGAAFLLIGLGSVGRMVLGESDED